MRLDNIQTLRMIEKVVVEGRDSVVLNKTWEDIHAFLGIGTRRHRHLLLTRQDRETLNTMVSQRISVDLRSGGGKAVTGLASLGRAELSQVTPYEKLSGKPVTEDIVLIGSPSGVVKLPDTSIALPAGMAVNCHYAHLHNLDTVVMVENLASMYCLNSYPFPECFRDAVMLFRGSPQLTPVAVSKAIEGVGQVICFPDYDPQGLMNSLTQRKSVGMLVPSMADIQHLLALKLNKAADFDKQDAARRWLAVHAAHLPCVSFMLNHRVALSEEAMTRITRLEIVRTSLP